jgi:hypothetical protein
MDSDGLERDPRATFIYRLPRLRRPGWAGFAVEAAHLLVLALWSGLLVAATAVIPRLALEILAADHALPFLARFSGFINIAGAAVGAFLIVTSLFMHLFELRSPRTILLQMTLLLLMTLVLVACQVFLTERLLSLHRTAGLLGSIEGTATGLLQGIRTLHGTALALALGAFLVGWLPRSSRPEPKSGPARILELRPQA